MKINKLEVVNLRNLAQVEVAAHAALNTVYGANGAGKTSLLEAIVLLSRGRSFRGNKIAQLIGPVKPTLSVFAELQPDNVGDDEVVSSTRIGIERGPRHWQARLNGQDLQQISDLAKSLAVVVMEPDSHALVSGSPEVRRRYIDWGVFHVEPNYLAVWRRFARALKQRNAALRASQRAALPGLESVMAESGEAMTVMREAYVGELAKHFEALISQLSPGLGPVSANFRRGWKGESLAQAFADSREREMERGSTQVGPHRADLSIKIHGHAVRDTVSRGEQKILATALVLAQARRQCETGRTPVILLDDLASEFDRQHFDAALGVGLSLGAQMWVTGVEEIDPGTAHSRFHVEHGRVRKMV